MRHLLDTTGSLYAEVSPSASSSNGNTQSRPLAFNRVWEISQGPHYGRSLAGLASWAVWRVWLAATLSLAVMPPQCTCLLCRMAACGSGPTGKPEERFWGGVSLICDAESHVRSHHGAILNDHTQVPHQCALIKSRRSRPPQTFLQVFSTQAPRPSPTKPTWTHNH